MGGGGKKNNVHPGTVAGREGTWNVSVLLSLTCCYYLLYKSFVTVMFPASHILLLDEPASAVWSLVFLSERCCFILDQEDKRRLDLLSHPCRTLLIEHNSPTWQGQLWSQNPFQRNALSIMDVVGERDTGKQAHSLPPLDYVVLGAFSMLSF